MTDSGPELCGRVLHPGTGRGELLVLDVPLSFWGGTDAAGAVIDAHHPQHGHSLASKVVVMGSGRGSSSSSAVLAEQIRSGNSPAAILLSELDTIVVIGALVASELYDISLPIVQLDAGSGFDTATGAAGYAVVVADPGTMTATIQLEEP